MAAINPGNNSTLAEVFTAGPDEVHLAVESAATAFAPTSPWRRLPPRARGSLLYKLADLIDVNRERLATIEALNNGKTYLQALHQDVNACSSIFRYWAGWADKFTGQHIPIGEDFNCETIHEPVGVCALIVPWNLPLIGAAAKLGPALTTGNTTVFKSAEQTPLSVLALADLIHQVGFPAGVVNILSGDGPNCGRHLIAHPKVDKISFTGSTEVGQLIAAEASRSMKRVTTELGGKNPVIVCADANFDLAVENCYNGLFWNKGEACAAGSRIFVHDSIYEKFVLAMKKKISNRTVGHPFDPSGVDQGAQVSEEHLTKILSYIELGKKEGAKLEFGGERMESKGNYLQPTLFSDVSDGMRIFKEEVFGPVMTLNRFSSVEEVIPRANDTPYGLAAGIFSSSIATCHQLSRSIRAGLVFVNCYHVVDVSAPFGGFKQSGIGREGGSYGLAPYVEVKNVVNRVRGL